MVRFKNMLIDTPTPLSNIEDRGEHKDPLTSECTYCRRTEWGQERDIRDVVVVRRWREKSVWAPELDGIASGGYFEWRCAKHPFNGNSSTYIENAPPHLVPERRERCEHVTLKSRCTVETGAHYEGSWLCSEHAVSVKERLRVEERMQEIADELAAE